MLFLEYNEEHCGNIISDIKVPRLGVPCQIILLSDTLPASFHLNEYLLSLNLMKKIPFLNALVQ